MNMADTKQTRALNAANSLMAIAGQLSALRATINQFVTQYNSEGYSTTWGNLGTCAQSSDGSLGAADGTPTAGHPINTGTYPTLNKAVTAAMLTNGVTLIEQLQNFFTNAAVTTGNYNQTVDDLSA
jgi:hypothetical protein